MQTLLPNYRQLDARSQASVHCASFNEYLLPDGSLWSSFYRTQAGYMLRYPGLADFTISSTGLEITVCPVPGVSSETIEHLYLNQVTPFALSRQFKLVLHGSAVELNKFAIAFLAASGRGKSTIAASFAVNGSHLLTDDGLQLENVDGRYVVQPSHPSIRLWDDSLNTLIPMAKNLAPQIDYTTKSRLLADDEVVFCTKACALKHIYFLGKGEADSITITPVKGRDAMIELVRHSFLLDVDQRKMLKHHFKQLSSLVKKPIFFHLDYPRRYDLLPDVREAVVNHVA